MTKVVSALGNNPELLQASPKGHAFRKIFEEAYSLVKTGWVLKLDSYPR